MRRMLLLVAAVALAGCDLLTGPEMSHRRPMDPVPDVYADWYQDTEACLGQTGDFGAVQWFVADSIITERGHTPGVYRWPEQEITLAAWAAMNEPYVRHEMVHHITGPFALGGEPHGVNGRIRCGDYW